MSLPPWRQRATSREVLNPAATLRFVCSETTVLPGWLHCCKHELTSVAFHRSSETTFHGGRYCLQYKTQPSGHEYLWYLHILGREATEFLWCRSADWLAYDSYGPCDQRWFGRVCTEPETRTAQLGCYFEGIVQPAPSPREPDPMAKLTRIIMLQGAHQQEALEKLQQSIVEHRESRKEFQDDIMDLFDKTVKSVNDELNSFCLVAS